jgi:F-type H+/Na+-transporting ATPase subunit alpha
VIIFAGTNGFIDDLPLPAIKKYEHELFLFLETKHPEIFAEVLKKREIDADLRGKMTQALEEFKVVFKP